jgi:hypothetical protein
MLQPCFPPLRDNTIHNLGLSDILQRLSSPRVGLGRRNSGHHHVRGDDTRRLISLELALPARVYIIETRELAGHRMDRKSHPVSYVLEIKCGMLG